jgi:hypothetical protein
VGGGRESGEEGARSVTRGGAASRARQARLVVAWPAEKHVFGAVGARVGAAGLALSASAAAGLHSGVRSELRRAPRAPRPLGRAGRLRQRRRLAVALAGPHVDVAGLWQPQGDVWQKQQQQQPGGRRGGLLRARPGRQGGGRPEDGGCGCVDTNWPKKSERTPGLSAWLCSIRTGASRLVPPASVRVRGPLSRGARGRKPRDGGAAGTLPERRAPRTQARPS